jgi:hypothetical protein
MNTVHLRLITDQSEGYHLKDEIFDGVKWLVAQDFNIRFTGTLQLQTRTVDLQGIFKCEHTVMLPVSKFEMRGFIYGTVSICDMRNIEVLTGPFVKTDVGMKWAEGRVSDHWTQVSGSWRGLKMFAGHLLQVNNLKGGWQTVNGERRLVEEGDAVLV